MDQHILSQFQKSEEFVKLIEEVGSLSNLHINQVGDLFAIVNFFLTGGISGKELKREVMSDLEVDSNQADQIIKLVDEKILKHIKQLLVSSANEEDQRFINEINQEEGEIDRLEKEKIVSEIENPTDVSEYKVVRKLTESTDESTKGEIIAEALEEAHAHEYPVEVKTEPQIDIKHRVESKEEHIVFLPTEEVVLDSSSIVYNQTKPEEKKEEEPVQPKKRPLSDIIPPNTPKRYAVDPYREPTE